MKIVAVDTETTGLSIYNDGRPFMVSLYFPHKELHLNYEWNVRPEDRQVDFYHKDIWALKNVLEDTKIEKVFHNAKFDIPMLSVLGVKVKGPIHDTMIAARVVNTLEPSLKLKVLCKKYLKIGNKDEEDLRKAVITARRKLKDKYKEGRDQQLWEDYWLPRHLDPKCNLCQIYCDLDTFRTACLWEFYKQGLTEFDRWDAYTKELELLPVLLKMESKGVKVNMDTLHHQIHKQSERKDSLKLDIMRQANRAFNPNSDLQLIEVLLKEGVPLTEKTEKSNQLAVGAPILRDFKEDFPIVQSVLDYRGADKGLAFFKNFLKLNRDGVIHTSYNQANVRTFRLSSKEPNLQNVSDPESSGGESVVNARLVFEPREGYSWYCIDYSSLEARIFASIFNERRMLEVFNSGKDIFDEIRRRIPALSKKKPGTGRKITKNVFYCKIFGGGAGVLCDTYDIRPLSYAQQVLKEFDYEYPSIKRIIQEISRKAAEKGYVVNAYGRVLDIDTSKSYKGVNYIVQSTAADFLKRAMISVHHYLRRIELDAKLLLSIHDELIIEIKKEHAFKWLIRILRSIMEDHGKVFQLAMPTKIKRVTTNWGEKGKEIAV